MLDTQVYEPVCVHFEHELIGLFHDGPFCFAQMFGGFQPFLGLGDHAPVLFAGADEGLSGWPSPYAYGLVAEQAVEFPAKPWFFVRDQTSEE